MQKHAATDYIPGQEDIDPESEAMNPQAMDDPQSNRDFRDTNYGDRMHTSGLRAIRDREKNTLTVYRGHQVVASWDGASLEEAFKTGRLDRKNPEISAMDTVRVLSYDLRFPEFEAAVHEFLRQYPDHPTQESDPEFRALVVNEFGTGYVLKNLQAALDSFK